jgi:hypothetical protein
MNRPDGEHAADWIVQRLHPFASDVGSLVPEGFAAYVRILHPARAADGSKVRWADLVRGAGAVLDPATLVESLGLDGGAGGVQPPRTGTLEPDELEALTGILGAHTGRRDSCWFALWEGYGWVQGPPAVAELIRSGHRRGPSRLPAAPPAGAHVDIPGRSFLLYRGPIETAAAYCREPTSQSPNLWWPEDRAWCVASEIDLHSTYVGGPQAMADQVLRDERLEALPAEISDPINAGPVDAGPGS